MKILFAIKTLKKHLIVSDFSPKTCDEIISHVKIRSRHYEAILAKTKGAQICIISFLFARISLNYCMFYFFEFRAILHQTIVFIIRTISRYEFERF